MGDAVRGPPVAAGDDAPAPVTRAPARGDGGAPRRDAPTPSDAGARAFWSVPIDGLLESLGSSAAGLDEAEATARLARVGPNDAAPPRRSGPLRRLVSQFTSPITVLLLSAAILSLVLGESADGSIILGILVVSGLLGFWQEHRASDAVEELLALVRSTVTVVRGDQEREVPIESVVPGDIIRLRAGSSVAGDARLLDARDLHVDEAALTGESFPAEKAPGLVASEAPLAQRRNTLFLGTHIVSGMGTALVVHTGRATEFGAVAGRLARRAEEGEFEHGVRRFGFLLLDVTMVLTIVIFAINVALHRPVLDALLFTLALAVGLTPQLLPAIVSVTLAHGARRMARARVIVRRLAAIEDLGGMSVLCTDKTGTLTEGVVAVHAAEDWAGAPSDAARRLACLNARFASGFTNPIDEALRALSSPDADGYAKTDEVPYDFVRRRLGIAVAKDDRRTLIVKGAVANVLDACESAESAHGERHDLAEVRAAIEARYEALSRDGLRCLAVAYRALPTRAPVHREDERALTFVGLLSFSDPLKAGASQALAELAGLGVSAKLITGDNRFVAARLATEAGFAAGALVTGGDLRAMSDAALVATAPRTSVFAEVEPNQKERIILALRKSGLAVGFLGDGINDASALHAADVGISVDSAADVTKQAADIVLLEKDLRVLSLGVREGRRAFANTLKYVFITTSANFGNMVSMAGASLVAAFLPMLPQQILLLNVLTDLPAMAIAGDRLDPELVARPRRWSNRGIARFMLAFGLVSSAFDVLTFGTLLAMRAAPSLFRTAWFVESVLSELLILLVIRTRRAFFRSPVGHGLWRTTLGVGALTLALPYLGVGRSLGFAPLPASLVVIVAGILAGYVATSEAVKRMFYRPPSERAGAG